jgi:serine/threonine-protein kinase
MDAGRLEVVAEAAPPAPAAANLVGGRFQLGSQIGGHRTGQVYSGTDLTTGREVALKFVSPHVFPSPLVAQRTERELKQLMKVHSDRVTMVLDVGKQGDHMWVASELVGGATLQELIVANGPLAPEHAIRLGLEVGEGLAEAAKLGVIHRDVSPKNVLVLSDGRIKILNFGIPTPVSERVQGIPEFLSPEQAEGKPVDQRSNIYSLGALLSFMMTGQTIFQGDAAAVLAQQVSSPPPSLSARGVRVPPEVDRIILKALEKQSSRRHLTLRQLLSELEALFGAPGTGPLPPQAPAPEPATAAAAKTMIGVSMSALMAQQGSAAPPPQTTQKAQAYAPPQPPTQQVAPYVPPQPMAPPPPAAMPAAPATQQVQPRTQMMAPSPPQPVAPPPASPYAQTQPTLQPFQPPPAYSPPTAPANVAASGPAGRGKRGSAKDKAKFRETMWFKKGELDEAVAAAQAPTGDAEPVPDKIDSLPIEDRYKDDGTLTAADRQRLSLRTGGTMAHQAVPAPPEKMGEVVDLARELGAGRARMILFIALAVVVIAGLVIYFGVLRK